MAHAPHASDAPRARRQTAVFSGANMLKNDILRKYCRYVMDLVGVADERGEPGDWAGRARAWEHQSVVFKGGNRAFLSMDSEDATLTPEGALSILELYQMLIRAHAGTVLGVRQPLSVHELQARALKPVAASMKRWAARARSRCSSAAAASRADGADEADEADAVVPFSAGGDEQDSGSSGEDSGSSDEESDETGPPDTPRPAWGSSGSSGSSRPATEADGRAPLSAPDLRELADFMAGLAVDGALARVRTLQQRNVERRFRNERAGLLTQLSQDLVRKQRMGLVDQDEAAEATADASNAARVAMGQMPLTGDLREHLDAVAASVEAAKDSLAAEREAAEREAAAREAEAAELKAQEVLAQTTTVFVHTRQDAKISQRNKQRAVRERIGAASPSGGVADDAAAGSWLVQILRDVREKQKREICGLILQDAKRERFRPTRIVSVRKLGRTKKLVADLRRSRPYKYAFAFVVLVHLALAFPELDRDVTAAERDELHLVEAGVLTVYMVEVLVYWRAFHDRIMPDRLRRAVFNLCWLLAVVDLALADGDTWRFSLMLRPLFLICRSAHLSRVLGSILRTFPKVLDVALLAVVVILFYSVLGMYIFSDAEIEANYQFAGGFYGFSEISTALRTMFELTTTESYPSVMYPASEVKGALGTLFFGSFVLLFNFLALPLVLAVIYDNFKTTEAESRVEGHLRRQLSMLMAFELLREVNPDETYTVDDIMLGEVRYERWLDLMGSAGVSGDELTMGAVSTVLRDRNPLIHAFGDARSNVGKPLTAHDFLMIDRGMLSLRFKTRWWDALKQVPWCAPLCFGSASLSILVDSLFFRRMVLFAILVNTVMLVLGSDQFEDLSVHDLCGKEGLSFLLVGYLGELLLKVLSQGTSFWNSAANQFDFFCLGAWTLLEVYSALSDAEDLVNIVRVSMILRFVSVEPRFALLMRTISRALFHFTLMLELMLLLAYTYAVVGLKLFSDAAERLEGTDRLTEQHANFDSLGSAMARLFQLTVLNNWNEIEQPNVEATNMIFTWYFSSYLIFVSNVIGNIVTGVIIDSLGRQRNQRGRHESLKEEVMHTRSAGRRGNTAQRAVVVAPTQDTVNPMLRSRANSSRERSDTALAPLSVTQMSPTELAAELRKRNPKLKI